jgi:hypothetical protein
MPITRQEFDEGRIDLAVPIVDILEGRPFQAFTAQELLDTLIKDEGQRATILETIGALESLVRRQIVVKKEISGYPMYTIGERQT